MPAIEDPQIMTVGPVWRTSRYSQEGRVTACVQAGGALLNLRDGSIQLTDPGEAGPLILLRPPTGPAPAVVGTEEGSRVAREPAHGSTGRTGVPQIPSPDEWLSQSTVKRWGRKSSRSDALKSIDDTVRLANKNPHTMAPLNTLLRAIEGWSSKSGAENPRAPVVAQLESVARARLDHLSPIEDVRDLVGRLHRTYTPAAVAQHHVRDVFGRLEPPEVPEFLVDVRSGVPHDYSSLTADEGVHFLRSMDIRRGAVESADMDPRGWQVPAGEYSVAHDRPGRRWAPDPTAPLLPTKRVTMPQVVHAVWLGSVPVLDGPSKVFWQTFRESARLGGSEATFVLWTDVTREEIQGSATDEDLDSPRARHLELLANAVAEADIVLVNVDEVYNASRAAPTTRLVQIERAKRSGAGWAAASDILRVQIVSDFGGMYVDGGDSVTTLTDLSAAGVVASESAFAVDYDAMSDGRIAYQNNALVAPPHHPLLEIHIRKLEEHYGLDQTALYAQALKPPRATDDMAARSFKRHSVMYRTGPDLTGKVLESVGYGAVAIPRVTGLVAARGTDGMSWLPDSQVRDRRDQTLASGPATLALTQDMVLTALRSTSLRDGDVDLFLLKEAISRHPRSDQVWEGVFEFLRSDEDLRRQVRAITRTEEASQSSPQGSTDHLDSTREGATIQLPERVLAMLDFLPGRPGVRMGRRSEAVRLRPPESRSIPGTATSGTQASRSMVRPLPAPPARTMTEARPAFRRPLRLAGRTESSPTSLDARRPWPLINRPVPGVTTLPSINRNVLLTASAGAVRLEADRFLSQRLPLLGDLNPVHGNENCNQAVVAVDRMLDGDTAVRIPPSGPAFYGMDLLQERRGGEFVPVGDYDDIIDRIRERPGSRGVVWLEWADGRSHLINVADVPAAGVVFLDGQDGDLAELPTDARWIGLMRYHPESGTESMAGDGASAVLKEQPEPDRLMLEPPGQMRRPRQASQPPATLGHAGETTTSHHGSWSLPARQAEVFYAQGVETLLAENPVRVPALFALLRRQTSAEERPMSMSDVFQRNLGRSLEDAVDHAVGAGRLSELDGAHVLTIGDQDTAPGTSATTRELALPYEHSEDMARSAAQFFQEMASLDMVLRMLGEMDRDLNVFANLRRAWADQYPTSAMEKALTERWPEHRHVIQDLMGYADMAPVPMTQVAEWYRRLSETTFEHVEYGTVPVTPDHPEDGCDIRAYHWSAQLMRWGAMPRQVFATHASDGSLAVKTPYARGARHEAEVTLYWRYHTAPVVQAQADDGRIVPVVLDPAFDRGPLLIEDWADAMLVPRGARYVEGGLAQVHATFVRERHVNRMAWGEDGLPSRHMVLLTDGYARRFPRPTTSRTRLNTSWDDAHEEARGADDRLHRHWVRATRRELERSLWSLMQNAGSHVTDDAGRQSLLDAMLGTARQYGTLPGFLDGNREVAWAAYRLLGEERFFTFSDLFPPVPDGEVLADDASGIVEISSDSKGEDPTAVIAQAMQTMMLADDETASLEDALTARSATADDDLADLRELAPASLVDMDVVAPGHRGQAVDSVRFDARRFQVASGDWVSDASVRLRIQAGPNTTDTDAQLLAEELVSVVEQQVNRPGFRLPGGDLFHLDLVVGADVHAAHHSVALQAVPGSVRRGDSHQPSGSTIDQALHDVTRMVGGIDRHTNPAADDELLLSARDLAAIWAAFQSVPAVQDSPHPLAPRDQRRSHEAGTPHVVTDQDGTQWASGSRSARDGEGNLIPDDQRACVEVSIMGLG